MDDFHRLDTSRSTFTERRQACRLNRLAIAACLAVVAYSPLAHAQITTKPVRLIVPFPPGGTVDGLTRVLAEKLRPQFPGGILVENKGGAGGNIGADAVYRSDADGTTLLVAPPGPIAINHLLYRKMSYDPTKFVPITVLATVPNIVVVNPKLPVKNVAELIAYLKANPGKVTYASQGNGSTSHLTGAMFTGLSGTNMVHIPYKGTGPAINDMLGGQVDVFFDNLSSSLKYHQAGKLRMLAVADETRSSVLPDMPTFAESGLPSMKTMNAEVWYAVVAPPGTPATIANEFQKAFASALAAPDVKQRLSDLGVQPRGWDTKQTGDFFKQEIDKWGAVIKQNKVTLD